jgi:hypothetical protein
MTLMMEALLKDSKTPRMKESQLLGGEDWGATSPVLDCIRTTFISFIGQKIKSLSCLSLCYLGLLLQVTDTSRMQKTHPCILRDSSRIWEFQL